MGDELFLTTADRIAGGATELSFSAGQYITVIQRDEGADWWYGSCGDKQGWFSPLYGRLIEQRQLTDSAPPIEPKRVSEGGEMKEEVKEERPVRKRVTPTPPSTDPLAHLEKKYKDFTPQQKEAQRKNLLMRLLTTEQTYLTNLETFEVGFIDVIDTRDSEFKRKLLTDSSIAVAFHLYKDIIAGNMQFFAGLSSICGKDINDDINPRSSIDLSDQDDFTNIKLPSVEDLADIISRFAPNLRIYSDYASNQTNFLNALQSRGNSLTKYLEEYPIGGLYNINTMTQSEDLPFERLLILPVDRYPEYLEILEQYLYLTPSSLVGYNVLERSVAKLSKYIQDIDIQLKKEEVKLELLNLQSQFLGDVKIFTPNRRLVLTREMYKFTKGSWRYYTIHLFNDALLYSKRLPGNVYKLHRVLDLRGCQFNDNITEPTYIDWMKSLTGSGSIQFIEPYQAVKFDKSHYPTELMFDNVPFVFGLSTQREVDDWRNLIAELMEELSIQDIKKREQIAKSKNLRKGTKLKDEKWDPIMQSLPRLDRDSIDNRIKIIVKIILREIKFCKNLVKLQSTLVQPLMDLSVGVDATINNGGVRMSTSKRKTRRSVMNMFSSSKPGTEKKTQDRALFDSSGSTFSVLGGTITKYKRNNQMKTLQNSDVAIFLQAIPELSNLMEHLIQSLSDNCKENEWNDSNLSVGSIFRNSSTLYRKFESYAVAHGAFCRILRDSMFNDIRDEMDAVFDPLTWVDFLEEPLAAPTRFLDYVNQLLEITPNNHKDYTATQQASIVLLEVVNRIDISLLKRRNYDKLLDIQESFVTVGFRTDPFVENLVTTNRSLIVEAPLTKVCRKKNKTFHFWLFNDYLVYGAPIPGSKRYNFNRALDLLKCRAQEMTEQNNAAFRIISPEKSFVVLCRTASESREWIETINRVGDEWRQQNGVSNDANTAFADIAPVWEQDTGKGGCSICGQEFTLFKRRHHCRKCGRLVCGSCSAHKILLKHIDVKKKQRICDICFSGKTPTNNSNVNSTRSAVNSNNNVNNTQYNNNNTSGNLTSITEERDSRLRSSSSSSNNQRLSSTNPFDQMKESDSVVQNRPPSKKITTNRPTPPKSPSFLKGSPTKKKRRAPPPPPPKTGNTQTEKVNNNNNNNNSNQVELERQKKMEEERQREQERVMELQRQRELQNQQQQLENIEQQRRMEEEQRLLEIQRQQEENARLNAELTRQREEEQKRLNELRKQRAEAEQRRLELQRQIEEEERQIQLSMQRLGEVDVPQKPQKPQKPRRPQPQLTQQSSVPAPTNDPGWRPPPPPGRPAQAPEKKEEFVQPPPPPRKSSLEDSIVDNSMDAPIAPVNPLKLDMLSQIRGGKSLKRTNITSVQRRRRSARFSGQVSENTVMGALAKALTQMRVNIADSDPDTDSGWDDSDFDSD